MGSGYVSPHYVDNLPDMPQVSRCKFDYPTFRGTLPFFFCDQHSVRSS